MILRRADHINPYSSNFSLGHSSRYRLVLPLQSSNSNDDEDPGHLSDTQSEKSMARANLSSAAEWVIANGDVAVSTEDIERHGRNGGESLSGEAQGTRKEIAAILEGIDRTDIA